MAGSVYSSDPDALPDTAFFVADLDHVAVGNRGRLLDARRTSLRITSIDDELCEIEVEIEAFEDRGARWRLPAWEISRLQLSHDSARARADLPPKLAAGIERFDRPFAVRSNPAALPRTCQRVDEHRRRLRPIIDEVGDLLPIDAYVQRRKGESRLYDALDDHLARHGLLEMDQRFTRSLVSNPRSGELVKGHAIVLAGLGLRPFAGTVVRDPTLFDGEWSAMRRAEHLLIRIAFVQELWAHHFRATARLYRAAATDGAISASRDDLPGDPGVNGTYAEAEALLIGDPANSAF